jgi:hypothetical protein
MRRRAEAGSLSPKKSRNMKKSLVGEKVAHILETLFDFLSGRL